MIERTNSAPILNMNKNETKPNILGIDKVQSTEDVTRDTVESEQFSQDVPFDQLKEAIGRLNEFIKPTTHVQFELHEKLNKYYVKVINDKTQEVIKEFPSKKLMDIYAAMNDFLGILFDKKI